MDPQVLLVDNYVLEIHTPVQLCQVVVLSPTIRNDVVPGRHHCWISGSSVCTVLKTGKDKLSITCNAIVTPMSSQQFDSLDSLCGDKVRHKLTSFSVERG